jgi:hypothetical protein
LTWLGTHSAIVKCWDTAAHVFAAGMTVLLVLMARILLQAVHAARLQQAAMARDHVGLAGAYAGLGAAMARADAKTAQLRPRSLACPTS